MYTYLLINLLSILGPLALSFDKKVAFYKQWKYLFPGILATGILFITWDAIFTGLGVWQFNASYLVGSYVFGLPVEELLFFFTIPYACMFIYACANVYIQKDYLYKWRKHIGWAVFSGCIALAYFNQEKLYTAVTSLFLAFVLLQVLALSKAPYLGRFFLSYLISLAPFLIVNGILTALPVVIYNDSENLGIRLFTIPVEDTLYGMLLMLLTTIVYEQCKKRY